MKQKNKARGDPWLAIPNRYFELKVPTTLWQYSFNPYAGIVFMVLLYLTS